MSNFCSNCGSKYSEGAKFCKKCGAQRPDPPLKVEKQIEPKTSVISIPELKETKALIEVSNRDAKEIATSLVFSAGALLPSKLPDNTMSSPPTLEDLETIHTSISFIEKIFNTFPEIKGEQWLGSEEYNKIKNYLSISNTSSEPEKTIEQPQPIVTKAAPEIIPPAISEPTKTSPITNAVPNSSSTEQIKSTIIDVHTSFGEIYYNLYLTDKRIIGARKDKYENATEAGAALGGILGSIVGAGVDATINRNKKTQQEVLSELMPDEILASDAQNWEMDYRNITGIELKNPGFLSTGEIILVEPNRRFEWIVDVSKDEFQVVIDMFNEVLPNKVKIK